MSQFWTGALKWDLPRVAASGLGFAMVLLLGAYAFGLIESHATRSGVVAAVAAVAIAGGGLLYAWRLGAGGLVD
jgi:hypothetical protein